MDATTCSCIHHIEESFDDSLPIIVKLPLDAIRHLPRHLWRAAKLEVDVEDRRTTAEPIGSSSSASKKRIATRSWWNCIPEEP